MTYTGDVLIKQDRASGEWGITFSNGQPEMTDGLETCVLLAVFSPACSQNGMITDPSEQFNSTFPSVIDRAKVSDETRENGVKAIEKALAFMLTEKIASEVNVTGTILSAYSIGWEIEIVTPNGKGKYAINWEKGKLTGGPA